MSTFRPSRLPVPLRTLAAGSLFLGLFFTTAGCQVPEGPREMVAPRIDVEDPFQSAGGGTASGPRTAESSQESSFTQRLRQRTNPGSTDRTEGATVALQRVTLPGGLSGELPHGNDGWSWAQEGELALAVREQGGVADALVYAQGLTSLSQQRPALETFRFQLATDPRLATSPMLYGSDLLPLASQVSPFLPLSTREVLGALEMLRTPTFGRGLRYRSQNDSFTGWRWIGSNRQGTYLRLGRTRGIWGPPLPLTDELEILLDLLSRQAPELGALLWMEPDSLDDESPAWMISGSATRDDGSGIHLAILCRLRPGCAAGEELGRFLNSLDVQERPHSGTGFNLESSAVSLQALALRHGLTLRTGHSPLDSEPTDLLQRALPQMRSSFPTQESEAPREGVAALPEGAIR